MKRNMNCFGVTSGLSVALSLTLITGMLASSVMATGNHPTTVQEPAVQAAPSTVVTTDNRLLAQANTVAELADGEIRKVDKENQKLTVKHGEIKNLDMPPMTMVFIFKDTAILEQLKTGDRIKFKAVNESGKYTITEVQRQP